MFELFLIDVFFVVDQDLFDFGVGGIGFFVQYVGVYWYMLLVIDVMVYVQNFGFYDGLVGFLLGKVCVGQEGLIYGDQF